ncbi:UDP-N-acetylmuramoyl-L-alanine--D-glutamate ligase [Candidatus Bipolaricaulota bacterium]|nr:UDP-N-acetylmuramoyl-L-alanine--D-glutamate ligase [Candidatus Bipolaricaulota bacterium]
MPFRKVAILGLGRTGRALVSCLSHFELSLFLSEARQLSSEERAFLQDHGVAWEEGGHTKWALSAELIVPSPGVPPNLPVLQEALSRKITIWSEIELAFRLARPSTTIAVTGTNGKSTVCQLIGAILRAAGEEPVVAGNIGRPAISTLEEARGRPWVLEVSSYQLEWTEGFRPQVAVWLNFAPDHLDHHGTLAHYFSAKARVLARQGEGDVAILPAELISRLSPRGRVVDYPQAVLPPGWGEGEPSHLLFDLKAAWCAAQAAFPGLSLAPPRYEEVAPAPHQPHRLELVGEFLGIPFINDSKATNPHATAAALRAIPGPVVLILGGRHKGVGYEGLWGPLKEKVRFCVLIGESQGFFSGLLSRLGIPCEPAGDPLDALRRAYARARPGDTVLLSPACASFDQFRDYSHRGEEFRAAFGQLSRA